jgi:hypothetical protein
MEVRTMMPIQVFMITEEKLAILSGKLVSKAS